MLHHTRIFILILCLFQLPFLVAAQGGRQKLKALNSLYLELGGNGDVYSLNYDRIIYQQQKLKAGLRAGIGSNLFFLPEEPSAYPIVPVEAFGMLGNRAKHFEFGLGYTRRFTDAPDLIQSMYFGRIGFRYQPPRGGMLVRLAATPFISSEPNAKTPGRAVVPRFGLSIGRSF
ncbi:hypothetical protein [Pontibacter vulgaris]|uniref:hypothetical protein n=1 Tax=Pontibacter vulgaris TaxID=2905679 RepID=UPI001FA79EAB|nr:hypothetical protein [Pontibacter vulgaris]